MTISDASNNFPYLIIRIFCAVYQKVPIKMRTGPKKFSVQLKTCFIQTPNPYKTCGSLSDECKQVLFEAIQDAAKQMQFRMCIVWAKDDCLYLEPEGILINSKEIPSGGLEIPILTHVIKA